VSWVQALESLQFGGAPPTHVPPEQVSLVVQALLSLHNPVLLVYAHPLATLHVSVVQMLPSLQTKGGPPWQDPAEQASLVVHALPSLQATVLFTLEHPVAGTQESLVHRLPSLQFGAAPPTQIPPAHVSFVVHAFESLHGSVLFA
jgi:hypothetical protein